MTNTRDAFKANLPIFTVTVRGNACQDGELFTSKSDRTYERFTLAYTPGKDKPTTFLKIMLETGEGTTVCKGDYVEVSGDYSEQVSGEYLNRTIFSTGVNILGHNEPDAPNIPGPTKASSKPAVKTSRKKVTIHA